MSASLGSNSKSNSSGVWFCTIDAGSSKGPFPKGAVANCSGTGPIEFFGYSWPR